MPLTHGKSKQAFDHNVATERAAGKSMKQSLAVSYNVKRAARRKQYARGGSVSPNYSTDMDGKMVPLDSEGEREVEAQGQRMAEGGVMLHSTSLKEDTEKARKSLGVGTATPTKMQADAPTHEPEIPEAEGMMKRMLNKKKPMYMEGGIVDAIMQERMGKHTVRPDHEPAEMDGPEMIPAIEESSNFSNYNHMPDEEHGDIPATDDDKVKGQLQVEPEDEDDSVVAQIMKARRSMRK